MVTFTCRVRTILQMVCWLVSNTVRRKPSLLRLQVAGAPNLSLCSTCSTDTNQTYNNTHLITCAESSHFPRERQINPTLISGRNRNAVHTRSSARDASPCTEDNLNDKAQSIPGTQKFAIHDRCMLSILPSDVGWINRLSMKMPYYLQSTMSRNIAELDAVETHSGPVYFTV
jgi:hypothetical protein